MNVSDSEFLRLVSEAKKITSEVVLKLETARRKHIIEKTKAYARRVGKLES